MLCDRYREGITVRRCNTSDGAADEEATAGVRAEDSRAQDGRDTMSKDDAASWVGGSRADDLLGEDAFDRIFASRPSGEGMARPQATRSRRLAGTEQASSQQSEPA